MNIKVKHKLPWTVWSKIVFVMATMFLAALPASSVIAKDKAWEILFYPQDENFNKRTLPDEFPMKIINDVHLEGVNKSDPFLFNDFHSSGLWGINKGRLTVTAGSDTMLQLGEAKDFELEGIIDAEGLGGWFILFGWNDDKGFMLYNVTLKKSGSPWMFTEIRGSRVVEGTHGEINRYDWKEDKPLYFQVKDNKVSLRADQFKIADEIELPNYEGGEIFIGTYKTRYGPKQIRVKSLRIKNIE